MNHFNDRLDAAIDSMMAGAPLPGDAALRSLLAPARLLAQAVAPTPSQRTARVRLNAALDARRHQKERRRLWPRKLIPAAALALMLVALLLANFALPGQAFYPIKQGEEALAFLLQRTPQAQADYYVRLADRRMSEIERLTATGRPVPPETLSQFQQAWRLALALPGADRLQDAALAQAQRLQALAPTFPSDMQQDAQDFLDGLMQQFQIDVPPGPTPTPVPPRPTPQPTPTPQSTPSAPQGRIPPVKGTPEPTPSATGIPTSTPASTPAIASPDDNTAGSGPTPSPEATETPETASSSVASPSPTPTSTLTPRPHRTRTPRRTPTPTRPRHRPPPPTRTPTPDFTATPEPGETPEPDKTHTPEPDKTHTPEPEQTPIATPAS